MRWEEKVSKPKMQVMDKGEWWNIKEADIQHLLLSGMTNCMIMIPKRSARLCVWIVIILVFARLDCIFGPSIFSDWSALQV